MPAFIFHGAVVSAEVSGGIGVTCKECGPLCPPCLEIESAARVLAYAHNAEHHDGAEVTGVTGTDWLATMKAEADDARRRFRWSLVLLCIAYTVTLIDLAAGVVWLSSLGSVATGAAFVATLKWNALAEHKRWWYDRTAEAVAADDTDA